MGGAGHMMIVEEISPDPSPCSAPGLLVPNLTKHVGCFFNFKKEEVVMPMGSNALEIKI